MESKFENKDATEYFYEYSKDFISTCYEYFLTQKPKVGFQHIYVPDSEGEPPFYDKFLCVLSYINNYFEANVFQLLDEYLDSDEVAQKSGSSLPSLRISDM